MPETIRLTVNGEPCTATVPARTQLAEVLRDHLDLTGTHLACEQGVCGACTVMMDGQPVRACITYAHACDGAVIETIEGHAGDPVMDRLRDAFSRHHALQCGFCTPGMLATARDIVARFDDPDEATIRHELSGNLCRCTGYVGIVNAIRDVVGQRHTEGGHAECRAPALPPRPAGFRTFE
uniref:(2Fe-2S)-binding protein n=1 Tax=Albidovulum sp. TaxID=1872424 RepID=UPI0039B88F23